MAEGQPVPSTNTSAYCKARQRIRERLLVRFVRKTGKHLHERPEPELLWCGRRVTVFDGSRLTMANTSKNQARKTNFRRGKRLARWDHIVEWVKPKQRPKGLKKKLFDALPQRILLREVRFHIPIRGFRTEDVTYSTSYTRFHTLMKRKFVKCLEFSTVYCAGHSQSIERNGSSGSVKPPSTTID